VLHLLLIEDNPADVLMVREALRSSPTPADVIIAYDGEQALRMLSEFNFKPDFVILDLNIPKVDGHAILERYQSAGGPPIVVFTHSANEEDRRRALASGARDYVVKPANFRPFLKTVQDILSRWGSPAPAES
jgi:DNA-binding response OmpR family regulator